MINLLIFMLFSIVLSLLLSPSNCIAEEISYWVTHGTTCVSPDEIPKGVSEASIKAARNEYEPFQLIVRSQDNIKNVDVTVSDLAGSNGAKIGKENIALFREHYVYVAYPAIVVIMLPDGIQMPSYLLLKRLRIQGLSHRLLICGKG